MASSIKGGQELNLPPGSVVRSSSSKHLAKCLPLEKPWGALAMIIQPSATSLPGLVGRPLSLLSQMYMGRNRAPLCGPSQALGKASLGVSTANVPGSQRVPLTALSVYAGKPFICLPAQSCQDSRVRSSRNKQLLHPEYAPIQSWVPLLGLSGFRAAILEPGVVIQDWSPSV